ncbi:right-handed parallel beta-helix repeat-containing protein [Aeoliella sp. ICT_H6.2]|uniref:Probable pectate lyase C n=1 Tax=Aeoliella straminimaris TaxID=2954799 RepID=A0A9X2F8K5_9BACT|nr:right-handed parallel beta-helix repeat-containing protein [Aeoliella straminimaris]MCO6044295.1 right-handed parallel beta-helix repeat-containing protein [Aeoliella straminimaris]
MKSRGQVLASLVIGLLCWPLQAPSAEYYIAPGGSDANGGSIDSPWGTFNHAIDQIGAGDTLLVRGGTYDLSSRIRIQKGGVSRNPINMWAYPGETPILDFDSNPSTSDRGIQLERDWWNIRGLTIQNAPDNGVWVSGSNNTFEQLVLRWNGDSGLQLSGDSSRQPSNNLILNTDSYENYDPQNHGENADGFAAKFRDLGPGNVFSGNRAWGNSDDGWDFWAAANGVVVENSWAFDNGFNIWNDSNFAGDGNGIKLGQDSGRHELSNMLVWGNASNGVDVNGNATPNSSISPPHVDHGVAVYNVTSYDNGNRNFRFDEDYPHVLRNNISFTGSNTIYGPADDQFNTWNGLPVRSADFLSLDDSAARGPRLPDGSLPVIDFLRLAPNSSLIDAGTDVGLPFYGSAPDLGAFETQPQVLAGDFNGDGFTDLADYTLWRNNLGSADDAIINYAGDDTVGVGLGDYQVWRASYGSMAAASHTTTVPEPSAIACCVLLAIPAVKLRFRIRWVFAAATLLSCAIGIRTNAQAPVFSGAEGYGGTFSGSAPAAGWFSDATVYHVTNLNDSGPGSFRDAFDENSANKVVVFDVAGTIQLTSGKLDIKNLANYYIAGQTAPGPVTVYGNLTQLTHSSGKENRNVVMRYLSFRKGDGDGSDAVTFAGSGLGTNLILDHVSASWAEDEILSVANNNTNVTVQYSMIHDALVNNHAYGSLIRPRIDSQVTFHHNLYANNASRQARFGTYNGETLTADFRNNVVYNFRDRASYTGGSSESEQEHTDVNYVGNYIIAGPGTEGTPTIAYSVDKNVDTRVYQSGNFIDPDEAPGGAAADGVLDGNDTGWDMFRVNNQTDQTLTKMAAPFATPAVTTQSATDAYHQVVDYVGNWWWKRDAIDSRVISNVENFTGVPIGAAAPISSELNGLLAAPQQTHPAGYDADGDGMEDTWESMHGGDLTWNDDFDNDGYINLIEFINEKGQFPAPAPIVFEGATSNRYAAITNWRTDDGSTTIGTHWQPARFDDAVIHSGTVVVDAVGQHAGRLWIAPESADNATLQVASGWLNVEDRVEVGSHNSTGTLIVDSGAALIAPQVYVGPMGTLTGAGQVIGEIVNEGTVSPGASPGTWTIDGDFTQTTTGLLHLELASDSEFDRLEVLGNLTLEGTLEVSLLEGYRPKAGDTFELLAWSGGSDIAFESALFPELDSGVAWDQSQLATSGTLSVVAVQPELPGDYNDDGFVDLADYTMWRNHLGSPEGTLPNDSDGGTIGSAQYQTWKNNFGNSTEQSASRGNASVPEPSAVLLFALGLTVLLTMNGRC